MLYAGTDEAGIGALAGPIVAATVTLRAPVNSIKMLRDWWPLKGVTDSKKLSERQRESLRGPLSAFIAEHDGEVGISIISVSYINEHGYAKSLDKALKDSSKKATKNAGLQPRILVVDGNRNIPGYPWKQEAIPKADNLFFHVSAASIMAKLTRDDIMVALGSQFPEYGFAQNKGYPTADHRDALLESGLSEVHRTLPCTTVLRKTKGPRRRPEGW